MTTHAITQDNTAILTCQSFVQTEQVILLHMRCQSSPGCSFIPLLFILNIFTYYNINTLPVYGIFNIILKVSF